MLATQPPANTCLSIPLGSTVADQVRELQKIKDAMIRAAFTLIETGGIEKGCRDFEVLQIIYLEADYMLSLLATDPG